MTRFLAGIDAGIAKLEQFAAASRDAQDAVAHIALAATDSATVVSSAMDHAAASVKDLRTAFAEAALAAQGLKGAGAGTGLGGAAIQAGILHRELADISADLITQTSLLGEMNVALGAIQRDMADTSADLITQTALLRDVRSLLAQSALAAGAYRTAMRAAAADTARAGGGGGLRLWGTGIRLTTTAVHGLIAGLIDLAAVVIPASIAAGAWAAVWAQGATNVAQHMKAVYTATQATSQMFHVTAGQAAGLGNSLQKAQDAANPDVYQALGAAVNIARQHFGGLAQAGLRTGRIFDTFAAKLVYDFGPGGAGAQVNGLLSQMVPDLVKLGQFAGNSGHALLNLAADMPGVANAMLNILGAVSRLFLAFSELPRPVIMTIFALHELNTWGSVVVAGLGRMGLANATLSGSYFGLGRAIGVVRILLGVIPGLLTTIGTGIVRAGEMLPVFGAKLIGAGEAMATFGADSTAAIGALSGGWVLAIAAVAAGLGFLIDKMVTARSSAQQFADSLQAAADRASNAGAFNVLARNLGALQGGADQARGQLRAMGEAADWAGRQSTSLTALLGSVTSSFHHFGQVVSPTLGNFRGEMTGTMGVARAAVQTLTAAQRAQAQEFVNVGAGATYLAGTYHTTLLGAMVLADQAGVKLAHGILGQGQAAVIARLKIADLVQGYRSMGQPLGAVGKDMTALAIQSGLAASKVSQLNQAWDEFMGNLTGGTSGLASFGQSLTQLTKGASKVTTVLGKGGSVTVSVQDFAKSLTSFTGKGAQAWQGFSQVVGSTAPQLIDWFRTAGAEGALSGRQFQHGILDMLSQLTPLASRSKVAQAELLGLAQQAGLGIKRFPQLEAKIRASHASVKDLAKIVSDATIKMGDMSAVAQKLGTVMNNDIIAAMDAAKLKVSGVAQATVNYTNDIRNSTQWTAAGQADRQRLIRDLEFTGLSARAAMALVRAYTGGVTSAGDASQHAARQVHDLELMLHGLHDKTVHINIVTSGTVPQINLPGHAVAASGGVIPGYAPGRDSVRALLSPGEGVLVPEAVRGLGGPGFVHAANQAFAGHRIGARQFADGGMAGLPSADAALRAGAGHMTSALNAAAGMAGGGTVVVHNHIYVPLPGSRDQYREVQAEALRVNRRNTDNRLSITRGRGR